MKKKTFEIQRWMFLAGIPTILVAVLGVILLFSRTVVTFADMPKRVEAAEQKIESVEDYIKEQRIANDLMRDMFKQQQQTQQSSCEQDRDGVWWCLDSVSRQWFKQGGQ